MANLKDTIVYGVMRVFGILKVKKIEAVDIAVSNNLTMGGSILVGNALAVAAAGTTQATGTAITKDLNMITSGTGGVTLPAAVAGRVIEIINTLGVDITVYPATGANIDSLAANAGIKLVAGATITFTGVSTTKWMSSVSFATDWNKLVNKPVYIGATAGTSTAYTYTNAAATLADGLVLILKLNVANDKAATLNMNAAGAKSILDVAGKPISKGYGANSYIILVYNGTAFIAVGGIGGGAGGITQNAADLGVATTTTATQTVGGALFSRACPASTAAANIVTATFDDLAYGSISVMLRIALGSITNTSDLIKIESYHYDGTTETLLNTATIKPSDFAATSTYETFGFVTEFKGNAGLLSPKLRIKISILSNTTSNTFYFDYIRVAPTYTSIYSLPTT